MDHYLGMAHCARECAEAINLAQKYPEQEAHYQKKAILYARRFEEHKQKFASGTVDSTQLAKDYL